MNSGPFSIWDSQKYADYYLHDDAISEYYFISGLGTLVYKYKGPSDQGETGDATQPNHIAKNGKIDELSIQDWLYMENRDKTWDLEPYELRGLYQPQDAEFDLRQFGIFLDNDVIYITYHYNDMIKKLGRKIMTDDILEFPNLRDYDPLNSEKPSLPKLYVVTDASRSADGHSPTWHYHVWRVKCKPMVDSQEYSQFLNKEDEQTGFNLKDIISDFGDRIGYSESIAEEVMNQTPHRNFDTRHFFIVPGDEVGSQYPWIWAGDGLPPNGAVLAATGMSFPGDAPDGSYFLHTGFEPNILYKKDDYVWRIQEYDYQRQMSSAHRILESFINNNNETKLGDQFTKPKEKFSERQYLSKAIKPKADFGDQSGQAVSMDPNTFKNKEPETKVRRKRKPKADI